MKCSNCGFESETNFCPMCGANMKNQTVPNNHKPIVQTPQLGSNMQEVTPPAFKPEKPEKKISAGVVVAVILGVIILAGVVINSYSCISHKLPKKEELKKDIDFKYYYTESAMNEVVKTSYGSITLKSVEDFKETDGYLKYDNDYNTDVYYDRQYKLTFEIENNSDETITVSRDDFKVEFLEQSEWNDSPRIVDKEDEYTPKITLNSGEKKDFSVYHKFSDEVYKVMVTYKYTDESANVKHSVIFEDYIEYKKDLGYSYMESEDMNMPFGKIELTNVVEKEAKGDSSKIYELTLNISNVSLDSIEIPTDDFVIIGDNATSREGVACPVVNDEVFQIESIETKEIKINCDVSNDCKAFGILYKFNNHITNPDEPVSATNYNIYWAHFIDEKFYIRERYYQSYVP